MQSLNEGATDHLPSPLLTCIFVRQCALAGVQNGELLGASTRLRSTQTQTHSNLLKHVHQRVPLIVPLLCVRSTTLAAGAAVAVVRVHC